LQAGQGESIGGWRRLCCLDGWGTDRAIGFYGRVFAGDGVEAGVIEGFPLEPLTWLRRVGYAGIAACLLWPRMGVHAVGVAGLILFVVLENALHTRRAVRASRD